MLIGIHIGLIVAGFALVLRGIVNKENMVSQMTDRSWTVVCANNRMFEKMSMIGFSIALVALCSLIGLLVSHG